MTSNPSEHGDAVHSAAGGATAFSEAEWDALQSADRHAARNIVRLMAGIFILGLIGYLCIAIWVAQ
jgi:hypothetical protein